MVLRATQLSGGGEFPHLANAHLDTFNARKTIEIELAAAGTPSTLLSLDLPRNRGGDLFVPCGCNGLLQFRSEATRRVRCNTGVFRTRGINYVIMHDRPVPKKLDKTLSEVAPRHQVYDHLNLGSEQQVWTTGSLLGLRGIVELLASHYGEPEVVPRFLIDSPSNPIEGFRTAFEKMIEGQGDVLPGTAIFAALSGGCFGWGDR